MASVFINEIHYDNTGTDAGELVEVAAPVGMDLTGYSIVLYNGGTNGAAAVTYDTDQLGAGVTPAGSAFSFYTIAYPSNGIQNGAFDAVALVDASGNVVQFLSYEGVVIASNGPAAGLTSTDIGVSEAGTEAAGLSLQLTGTGDDYADFTWAAAPANDTPGAANNGQTFTGAPASGATISISATDAVKLEGDTGTTPFTFTVTRTGDTSIASSATYTIAGSGTNAADSADFSGALSGLVAFAAGETSQVITATVAGDTIVESDETFSVTLSAPSTDTTIGTAAANGTIRSEEAPVTLISAVQGSASASTLVGQTVTIEAIVVGDFQNGDADATRSLGGFYLQEELVDQDGNALTSEGVFIYEGTGSTLGDVQIGDRVRVTGVVGENFGQTQITITSAASVVEAGAVADINDLAVEVSLPSMGTIVAGGTAPQPDLEAYEGMLATFTDTLTISEQFNLDRFNEIKLFAGEDFTQPGGGFQSDRPYQYSQYNDPDAAGFQAYLQELGQRTITYEDGVDSQNQPIGNLDGFQGYNTGTAPRMGDQVTDLTGVVTYGFNAFRIRSAEDGTNAFVAQEERPSVPAVVEGELKVASFNVLNFFTTLVSDGNTENGFEPRGANTPAEFDRQLDKLVDAIIGLGADVVSLIEMENDFLADNGPTAIQTLVDALNAEAGAGTYAFVDPGQEFVGGDAIAVSIIYKPANVRLAEGTTVEILDDSKVDPDLLAQSSIGAIFNGTNTSRAVLAATFEEIATGEQFTVAANHFKSKSGAGTGSDADAGGGAGNWNNQRVLAATALDAWLATNPTGASDDRQLILGDLNSYAKEDPIDYLTSNGFTDLAAAFLDEAYSYLFDGQLGTLDYALANMSLLDEIIDVLEWHINSDEADALDYNLDFGRDPAYFDGDTPSRTSDHDPVVVGLTLDANVELYSEAALINLQGRFGALQAALDTATTGQAIAVRDATAIGDAGMVTVSDDNLTITGEGPFDADLILGDGIVTLSLGGSAALGVTGNALGNIIVGNSGDNAFAGLAGDDRFSGGDGSDAIDGGDGIDTAVYSGSFADYDGNDLGSRVEVSGATGDDTLINVERLVFADGTIDLDDGDALFDTLYYYSQNPDVFAAGFDALAHYQQFGEAEGRDPNAVFDVSAYLALNPDVAGSDFSALEHYRQFGAAEGREIGLGFDAGVYLARNADVAASGFDALTHYLQYGQAEGRDAPEAVGNTIAADGFDADWYLLSNPDVAASGFGARAHYDAFGEAEGRDPNSYFDTSFYLASNPDVAASGFDPLAHYNLFGFEEGRDPSEEFDTSDYLAANADVDAANVNPLTHYLQFGVYEGRSLGEDSLVA